MRENHVADNGFLTLKKREKLEATPNTSVRKRLWDFRADAQSGRRKS